MEELISVIVPVYNVKEFLVECLDSIINQSYKNLEIILVDDGSDDGSENICDEYSKKDSRIKVIHQENKGLSVARNVGIDNSKGNFLTFIDSDDYIHKEMLNVLYTNIKIYDSDISICNYSNKEDLQVENIENVKVFCTHEQILGQLYNEHVKCFGTAWGKLYNRDIFNEIRYPANKKYEDTFIIHRVFEKAKKLVFLDNKLYYYRKRENSITNTRYSLKDLDEIEAIYERMEFVKENGYEYFFARDFYRYVNALRKHYIQIKKNFPDDINKLKYLKSEFYSKYNKDTRNLIINNNLRWSLDLFKIRLFFEKN